MSKKNLRLQSTLHGPSGKKPYLEFSFVEASIPTPKANEVVIRVEACPINPSDLISSGLFSTNLKGIAGKDSKGYPTFRAEIEDKKIFPTLKDRFGESFLMGIEGSGTVIAAGSDPQAQKLVGKLVAVCPWEGMYSQYVAVDASQCLELLPGTTPRQGASSLINPVTVLGFLEVMKQNGFKGIIHTAAASALGQMLVRVCKADNIPLINIVRRQEQVDLLKKIGAKYVINTSKSGWVNELAEAIHETGVYLAYDAIGGGRHISDIFLAMEQAAKRDQKSMTKYGSTIAKQVYIYGLLDTSPTILTRDWGMWWNLGVFMLTPYLVNDGSARNTRIRERIAKEIKTNFATEYTDEISPFDITNPEILQNIAQQKTSQKYLVNPQKIGKQETRSKL